MIAGIMLGLCVLGALAVAYEMGKATGYECGYSDARALQRVQRRMHEGTDRFNSFDRSTGR